LDTVVDLKSFTKGAEMRMWKVLKSELEFNISMQEPREILGRFAKSRVDLVILHVDLIGSTKLSMTRHLIGSQQ
jgi:adenylate cyclase